MGSVVPQERKYHGSPSNIPQRKASGPAADSKVNAKFRYQSTIICARSEPNFNGFSCEEHVKGGAVQLRRSQGFLVARLIVFLVSIE
jgi:hypothetical protein